jgi:hypothetical protein
MTNQMQRVLSIISSPDTSVWACLVTVWLGYAADNLEAQQTFFVGRLLLRVDLMWSQRA